jgi:ribonucleoside-diphosphate reductase alpha chain
MPSLGTGKIIMTAVRKRLPNRRPSHTETLEAAGQAVTATIGFDPADDQPRELFLTGGKEGSTLDALLADAAVVISVALQHGVTAQALAKSIGRLPDGPVTPADLDQGQPARLPASPIGAALDLVSSFEKGPE